MDPDTDPANLCRTDPQSLLKSTYFVNISRWSYCKGWSILTLQFCPRIPAQAINWSSSRSKQVRPADPDPHNLSGSDL